MARSAFAFLVLIAGVLAGSRMAAEPATKASPTERSFATDPRFQGRMTVRVAAMPLHDLLPRIGKITSVPLTAAPEIAGQKVALFAEDRAAGELLDALTGMLNMAPEGGYAWSESGRGTARVLRLGQSLRARSLARSRLAEEERAMLTRLHEQLQKIAEDPAQRRAALDPQPDDRFRRATFLASRLTRKQLERLLQEGSLVLRARELPDEHRRVLHLMEGDLRRSVGPELEAEPNNEVLLRLTQDLDPAEFSLMLELRQVGTALTLSGIFRPGWDKPGISVGLNPGSSTSAPVPIAPPFPDEPPLSLNPPQWTMGASLSEIARKSETPLVSDCYWLYWFDLKSLQKAGLTQILAHLDHTHRFRSEVKNGFIRLRSRDAYQRQSEDISLEAVVRSAERIEREGTVSLDLMAELPRVEAEQVAALRDHPDLQTRGGRAAVFALNSANVLMPAILRLYSQLSPLQRRQIHEGGCRLSFGEMSPRQRAAFALWLRQRHPSLPDAEFGEATLNLQVTADRRLEVRWEAGGEQKRREFHLDLLRVTSEGDLFPEIAAPIDPRGRTAPSVRVLQPDGTPVTLGPAQVESRVLLFWNRWGVPYAGAGAGLTELEALAKLLRQHPELAARTALIVPDLDAAGLRKWSEALPTGLPVFADPEGAAARLYGANRPPRAVRITPDGRVAEVVDGFEGVGRLPWEAWLGGR